MSNAAVTDGRDLDIVALVQADHRAVRALLAGITEAAPEARAERWPEVLRTLAVHEVAEELVVFPAVRVVSSAYDAIISARIAEQTDAEELLVAMGDMDPASPEFAEALARLQAAVLAHAEAEERGVLPLIAESDKALDRPTLGSRFEAAKRRAPTHPHPHAPHAPPGNMLVGPIAAFMDRVRDHLR